MEASLILPDKKPYSVLLGIPTGGGPCLSAGTATAIFRSTQKHSASFVNASGSWCNFNRCLAIALTNAEAGRITHFAMLHTDVTPEGYWIDTLIDELDRLDADLISTVVPIKDPRGVTSSGIGDPNNRWGPLKRFTMQEVYDLPETFNEVDAGFPGYPLLHNHGCFVCDMRRPIFSKMDANGIVAAWDFTQRIVKDPKSGEYVVEGESEDWYWSRMLHGLGVKSYITRKVRLTHEGSFAFPNTGPWGVYDRGDEDTKERWLPIANAAVEKLPTAAA